MMLVVFGVAFGLFLAFEGLTYALVPYRARAMAARIATTDPDVLRRAGLLVAALGAVVIFAVASLR